MEERKLKPRPRKPRRKVCGFCVDKVEHIDYKDTARLRKFVSERGKIMPRRRIFDRVENQAGERGGAVVRLPPRFTADGNADRIRAFDGFVQQRITVPYFTP